MSDHPTRTSTDPLTRRRALSATTVAASALLGGCQSLPFSEETVETGHLFVQNREDRPVEVALAVVDRSDDDRLVHATYRVPANTALQFDEVLRSDARYTVRAVQPNLDRAGGTSLDVVAETCEEGDPAGKVDVAVSVSSNGPEISVFGCQTPYTRTETFTYDEPSGYRIGTPTGTVGSPTPS